MAYYYYAKTAICNARNKHVALSLFSFTRASLLCIFNKLISLEKRGKENDPRQKDREILRVMNL